MACAYRIQLLDLLVVGGPGGVNADNAAAVLSLLPEEAVGVLPERAVVLAKLVTATGNDVLQSVDNVIL